MEYTLKYLFLIVGFLLMLASSVRFFRLLFGTSEVGQEEINEQSYKPHVSQEVELVILLVGLMLGGILLRQAYVMFTGISRSAVF